MKKLTLSVAALTIAMMSYGQCNTQDVNGCSDSIVHHAQAFQVIEYRLNDLIDAIRMDMYYGKLTQENGMYYIQEVLALRLENRELMINIFRNE